MYLFEVADIKITVAYTCICLNQCEHRAVAPNPRIFFDFCFISQKWLWLGQISEINYVSFAYSYCNIGNMLLMMLMMLYLLDVTGAVVPTTITTACCAIPFTLGGKLHYSCTDNGAGLGCFYGNRKWKNCQQTSGTCVLYRLTSRIMETINREIRYTATAPSGKVVRSYQH